MEELVWKEKLTDMDRHQDKENDKLLSTSGKNSCLRWMSLLAGGFAHAMLASNLIFYVYINEIKEMFNYNQTEVEIFASMLNAGIGLGFLPNLIGRKLKSTWVLLFGMLLSTTGTLLLWSSSRMISFYEDKSWLMAVYFLISGLGGSVAYIMSLRFNSGHFSGEKRGRIIALMFIFIDIGMMSFTLVYYKAFTGSMRFDKLMIVVVCFNAFVYLFCMIFLRSPSSAISEITVEKEELQSENFTYQPIDAENLKEQSFSELLLSMDYQLLAILCSSTFAVSLLLSNNLTVLTREEGLSSFDSIITLLYPPLVITSALLFSVISDKAKHVLSRISFINIGGMCLCISSILNAFISTSRAVVVTAVVFGAAGTGIVYTIGPTAMSEMFHIDNFMRNWGLVMLMRAILIIILHVIFGALYDMELKTADAMFCKGLHCTRYGYIITGGVALVAVGIGICLIVRRNRKIRELIKCFDKHE